MLQGDQAESGSGGPSNAVAGPSSGGSGEEGSLMGALEVLNTQCSVFRRGAAQLGEGAEEIELLSIALEICENYERLRKVCMPYYSKPVTPS